MTNLIEDFDDNDPRLLRMQRSLEVLLAQALVGQDMTPETFLRVTELIKWFRTEAERKLGLRLPPLTAVVLPSARWVHLCRADLPDGSIAATALNLKVQFPDLPREELRAAMLLAFPDYRGPP